MSHPNNTKDENYGLCMDFTIYQWCIVDIKHLKSEYLTNLEVQDMTVSPPCSQNQNNSYYTSATVECHCHCTSN